MVKIIFHAKKSAAPDFSETALLHLHISYQSRDIIWTHRLTWI